MSLLDIINSRFSSRKYSDKKIPEDVREQIENSLVHAPSGKNQQPWKFILIEDDENLKKLKKSCKNQAFISQASMVIVGCGFPEKAYPKMGGYWNSVCVDVSIALTQAMLVAKENGLDTCWVGAFYEEEVKELLDIPENVMVVSLLTVGYAEDSKKTGRKNKSEVICYEKFSK